MKAFKNNGNFVIDLSIHKFVSMKAVTGWKSYGLFECKEYEIKTNSETISLQLFRDKK